MGNVDGEDGRREHQPATKEPVFVQLPAAVVEGKSFLHFVSFPKVRGWDSGPSFP